MLRKTILLLGVALLAVFLAACETTDSASDPAAAQSVQPNLAGYDVQTTDNYSDALAAVAGTGALATGNIPLAAGIERVGTALECLQDVGAVSANIYSRADEDIIPQVGVSLIVNQTRVQRNIFACLTQAPELSAQAIEIQVCPMTGTFSFEGEDFYFAYMGVGDQICAGFEQHFQALSATFGS
jgi:hypothetical protein